jgi:ABC-type multidrug transport system fused ATPase/permease subunit
MNNNIEERKANVFVAFGRWCMNIWGKFKGKYPNIAQFLVFFMLSNGVTILQMLMFAVLNDAILANTELVNKNFQIWNIFGAKNFDGSTYYMFDYAAGKTSENGGGGLAFFLSMQITLALAQVINFFAQRNITFKHKGNAWYAAMWYAIAYVIISLVSAAALGIYKAPLYNLFINILNWGSFGQQVANIVVWIITCAISFWVFFPIFRVIFKNKPEDKKA